MAWLQLAYSPSLRGISYYIPIGIDKIDTMLNYLKYLTTTF
jgi:hypothetical protein